MLLMVYVCLCLGYISSFIHDFKQNNSKVMVRSGVNKIKPHQKRIFSSDLSIFKD